MHHPRAASPVAHFHMTVQWLVLLTRQTMVAIGSSIAWDKSPLVATLHLMAKLPARMPRSLESPPRLMEVAITWSRPTAESLRLEMRYSKDQLER
jgi:hypothetical protein